MSRTNNTAAVRELMRDGKERTREMIQRESGVKCAPQSTLRLLRFMRGRGYEIEKRLDEHVRGLFWYRAKPFVWREPEPSEPVPVRCKHCGKASP